MHFFSTLNPVLQALLATIFTWGLTALGAAGIFILPSGNKKIFNALLGFTAGIMLAASFWSLLQPAISLSHELGQQAWISPAIGFIMGGAFLWLLDKLVPHLHLGMPLAKKEGIPTSWHKTILLFTSITLHNIPEGLAVGVAFGAVGAGIPGATLAGAIALAIGIGIQNFPEGFAVSTPFRREGKSKWQSFMYGQASAIVEPIAAVCGALLVINMREILPYALAFAAGAMIYVTIEQIIPESQTEGESDFSTIGAMLGFVVMMILDVAFSK